MPAGREAEGAETGTKCSRRRNHWVVMGSETQVRSFSGAVTPRHWKSSIRIYPVFSKLQLFV